MTPARARKPDDLGDGYSCASVLPTGDWLALVRPHHDHGVVELTGAPPFDERWRTQPNAVRRYRADLTTSASGFLTVECLPAEVLTVHQDRTRQGTDPDGTLWQRLEVTRTAPGDGRLVLRFRGRLQRPPYGEITDTAPLTPLPSTTIAQTVGTTLRVESRQLRTRATVQVDSGEPAASWRQGHPDGEYTLTIPMTPARDHISLLVRCRLDTDRDPRHQQSQAPPAVVYPPPIVAAARDDPRVEAILAGTHRYIVSCCALRVADDQVALLTDHRLLPLSWTRDAYYMALLLLLTSTGDDQAAEVVASHLRWLWGPAHRAGSWSRSHLATGAVKDPGVQADQQLYPILELVDHRSRCGRWPAVPGVSEGSLQDWWGMQVTRALAALPRHTSGLLSSEENPADDPTELPFPFSTQILYTHVLDRLAVWQDELGLDGNLDPLVQAEQVRQAAHAAYIVDGPEGRQWAYEADLAGRTRLYADANDLPTAFAPAWSFTGATTPEWQATMRFAFSPRNPGWSPGEYSGLGSAHTPGTWPLGDVQALAWHQASGEDPAAAASLERLLSTASHDGLLPEAYDSNTGEWTARHWFGWPSAALGCVLMSPTVGVKPMDPSA